MSDTPVSQQQIEQLQRRHAAQDALDTRQAQALETGDEQAHGQRVWIIPEFSPRPPEREYLIEQVREALPEYDVRLATDSTRPMTKERIMNDLLVGDRDQEDDDG